MSAKLKSEELSSTALQDRGFQPKRYEQILEEFESRYSLKPLKSKNKKSSRINFIIHRLEVMSEIRCKYDDFNNLNKNRVLVLNSIMSLSKASYGYCVNLYIEYKDIKMFSLGKFKIKTIEDYNNLMFLVENVSIFERLLVSFEFFSLHISVSDIELDSEKKEPEDLQIISESFLTEDGLFLSLRITKEKICVSIGNKEKSIHRNLNKEKCLNSFDLISRFIRRATSVLNII